MPTTPKQKIFLVAAARRNFMKIAPIWHELQKHLDRCEPVLVHTGQHYDANMSDVFLEGLGLPEPPPIRAHQHPQTPVPTLHETGLDCSIVMTDSTQINDVAPLPGFSLIGGGVSYDGVPAGVVQHHLAGEYH